MSVFCTLATGNYLDKVYALSESLFRHCPETHLYVLVIDSEDSVSFLQQEYRHQVSIADLDLPDPQRFIFQYTAFELSNALKPYLLRYLRCKKKAERMLFLDGDMYVTEDLASWFGQYRDFSVLLVPHVFQDYPNDEFIPSTRTLQLGGVYNAGVLGVGELPDSGKFINWWCEKLAKGCRMRQDLGMFVDQRYLDMVPSFFDGVEVCREPGVNVAPFNLHERNIRQEGEAFAVNGQPLYLFHFTFMDFHQRCFLPFYRKRKGVGDQPEVDQLIDEYLRVVAEAPVIPDRYQYGSFSSGRAIAPEIRAAVLTGHILVSGDPHKDKSLEGLQARLVLKSKIKRKLLSLAKRFFEEP